MSDIADDMAGLRAAKKQLRSLVKLRLSQLPESSVYQQSTIATEALLSLPEYKQAERIGIYLSMPKSELSTRDVLTNALANNKKVFVPYLYKVKSHDRSKTVSVMDMVSLHSKSDFESLDRDAWGIPSVAEDSIGTRERILCITGDGGHDKESPEKNIATKTENGRLDMIIMPGVAFDKGLSRLGHGKGFYDNFLQQYHSAKVAPMPFLVGLALDVQLLPEDQSIPTDDSDWQLDALVVGNGITIRRRKSVGQGMS